MTSRPTRVIDAHVHIWDPARTDWYPYLAHVPEQAEGDPSRMHRRFDVDTYRAESAAWHVEKFVNVAAATGRNSVDETLELDHTAPANGGPDAIIGGLPPADTVAESVDMLDRQMAATRFRGIRPMGPLGDPVPVPDVLTRLAGAEPGVRAHGPSRSAPGGGNEACRLRGADRWWWSTQDGPARIPTRSGHCGKPASVRWPASATTWCANSRDWRCPLRRWRSTPSRRGSVSRSTRSALTAACSPATSRWTRPMAPSTSSTRRSAR